ncbi:Cytidyltransferase-like domain [uncultured Caudovirales phage]|uniref:Cytidyltransferase-like domain n=1 Tax=uncultured Caudovirales phage TaxID=2100421 RepID=A0A6J5Q3S8_9CAUD|nr:Cytidyltransferase-like domain [uncultured Caudovirales phage]CAB4210451.1 Cytidyltransferase-like domain [uncultured Caudovirales phage]CAB4223486.1 Cytidyltransferase-like domain [uncultured Caudovirales phage]
MHSKILSLNEAAQWRADDDRRAWVLCHGCFDLFHVGHLKHLQAAKALGDYLVVSITSDAFVNKGPGRPVFSAEKRAEMLAALECVDYVVIVDGPSALPAIEAIQPDIYCKGSDYKGEDITGKFDQEKAAVESHGGKVAFTDCETHSSSSLINEHMPVFDEETTAFLKKAKADGVAEQIQGYLGKIKTLKVLVVGEMITDKYIYVSALGKSAKENIIATEYKSQEAFDGGIAAVVKHIDHLCRTALMLSDRRLTKTRYVEPPYTRKLFEVYQSEPDIYDSGFFRDELTGCLNWADVIIVCDYGHGMITPEVVAALVSQPKFLAVNVQTNAGNLGYNLLTKYPRADFLCVDAMEARLAAQDRHSDIGHLAGFALPELIDCPAIVVTHGSAGCYVYDQFSNTTTHVPAFRQTVVDTMGAGDAFFAIASLFAYCGASPEIIGLVGNVAGAMKVGVVGHREPTDPVKFQRYIQTLLK